MDNLPVPDEGGDKPVEVATPFEDHRAREIEKAFGLDQEPKQEERKGEEVSLEPPKESLTSNQFSQEAPPGEKEVNLPPSENRVVQPPKESISETEGPPETSDSKLAGPVTGTEPSAAEDQPRSVKGAPESSSQVSSKGMSLEARMISRRRRQVREQLEQRGLLEKNTP